MKRFILFNVILLFLFGCDKDPIPTAAPSITTGVASNVLNTTATVSLSITDVSNSKEIGVLYSTSSISLPSTTQKTSISNFKSGDNSASLTGLFPGTTYYYKAYATDGYTSIYGEMKTFTTGIDYPTLTTNGASSITSTAAICGGSISNNGGGSINVRGVCWSTASNPTVSLPTKTVDRTETGSFASVITGLLPGTTYYVRAYATNEKGTAYGAQVTFTTLLVSILTVTTTSVLSKTSATAISEGNVIDDGGATVTARGVCWNTTSNPTITDSKTTDGTGTGTFISLITGLTSGTRYYVRAYATNSIGTAYGNQVSFVAGTMTDIDGNVYHIVTIGTQTWMVENLKTTRYRDGTALPNVTDQGAWEALITGAYCDYENTPSFSITYGKLYNWYAVNDRHNIAPIGWHIPSETEWETLTTYLGQGVAAGKLKEAGTIHWSTPNTGATNETGFTALPGGVRNDVDFYEVGESGGWWSSTENSTDYAMNRGMNYNSKGMGYGGNKKSFGFSVRCIMDY